MMKQILAKLRRWALIAVAVAMTAAFVVVGALLPYWGWERYRACNPQGGIGVVEWYLGFRPAGDPCHHERGGPAG